MPQTQWSRRTDSQFGHAAAGSKASVRVTAITLMSLFCPKCCAACARASADWAAIPALHSYPKSLPSLPRFDYAIGNECEPFAYGQRKRCFWIG